MAGIYWLISKVMLFWHTVWDSILPDHRVLSTNWQWVLAIVFLVITVRVVLFPIFVKQIKSQRAMQAIQPKMKELQDKHKGDRETLQKEVMKLYQEEKVNPLMGCLPMFLQIPVFIGLLHVLRHLRPGMSDHSMELYGWTKDEFLSAVDARLFDAPIVAKFSSSTAELLKIDASSTTVKIVAACLVALMITTTYLTQRQMIKKTGWNTDPQQRMIQKFMLYGIPFFTLTSGWYFPIGVIIYWVTNNAITLGQQYWVLHKYPPPASATTNTTPFKGGAGAAKKAGEAKQPSGLGALFSRAREEAAAQAQQRTNGKGPAKAAGTKATGTPDTAAPSRAPKPGAKPINPKKGGAAKRQSG
ncbi:membrane protein insertase YidC [Dactylosporangium sp. CA-233914]|uniref:membrane protein insertase YidC n=1 Tax=Dactylosporangium sp. CA-233914 TaxID=3239934 RepID=UPI003D90766F